MEGRLVHIGFGNMIVAERIVAIVHPSSAPIKRLKEEAKIDSRLIDATARKEDEGYLDGQQPRHPLSAIQPETIVNRYEEKAMTTGRRKGEALRPLRSERHRGPPG